MSWPFQHTLATIKEKRPSLLPKKDQKLSYRYTNIYFYLQCKPDCPFSGQEKKYDCTTSYGATGTLQ